VGIVAVRALGVNWPAPATGSPTPLP